METLLSQVFKDEGISKAFWSFIFTCIAGFSIWLSALYIDVQEVKANQQVKQRDIQYLSDRITFLQDDVKEIKRDVKSLLVRRSR